MRLGVKNIGLMLAVIVGVALVVHSQPNDSAEINDKIVYVELQATDLPRTEAFFEHTFGWNFAEESPTNFTFFDGRIAGGFRKSDKCGKRINGAALISIYTDNLDETRRKVIANGGKIVEEIKTTVDGRRFVFAEPSGNEFAVVSAP